MSIADLFVPGRRKRRRNLELSINGVSEAALASADELEGVEARLWGTLCESSRQTLYQLFIKNDEEGMDWGLKPHIKRVNDLNLVVIFWWTLVYQIVIFKTKGIDGNHSADDAGRMYEVSRNFVSGELSKLGAVAGPPRSWADDWERQFPLESAMSMYNSVYNLLDLTGDLTVRIHHVSYFTTITERAYDRLAGK